MREFSELSNREVGQLVTDAVAEMVRALGPHTAADWQVRAGALEWNCWTTAAHVAHDLLAYTGQLAAQPTNAYLPFDLRVRDSATPREILDIVAACGRLLSGAIAAAGSDFRAWHWGPTDPGGFAALGVNETILHTYDITQGLGVSWLPPSQPCIAVLARLFPDAPDGDPVQVLLWSTGRARLDGKDPVTSWTLKAALK